MDNGTRNKGTMNNSKNNGTRDKKQWEWDNKTKESNLKGTMEGLEIWYVTLAGDLKVFRLLCNTNLNMNICT